MCFKVLNMATFGSGDASQLPFKAEITPQVAKLMCFVGTCLLLGIFL